jgi:hypothetical protein
MNFKKAYSGSSGPCKAWSPGPWPAGLAARRALDPHHPNYTKTNILIKLVCVPTIDLPWTMQTPGTLPGPLSG